MTLLGSKKLSKQVLKETNRNIRVCSAITKNAQLIKNLPFYLQVILQAQKDDNNFLDRAMLKKKKKMLARFADIGSKQASSPYCK